VPVCSNCQGKLRRVHRTLAEKLRYAAVYECHQCGERVPERRWFSVYGGEYPRCPRCGTYRLTRMCSRDRIDSMQKGLVNFVQKMMGAELYHCRYCRVQFYDVRKPVAPDNREKPAPGVVGAAVPGSNGV